MNFKGNALRVTDSQIKDLAHLAMIEEAALRAFIEVESSGSGFDKQGRPKMLFEPHLFYRYLRDRPETQKKAVLQKIAYEKWGTLKYPLDSYPNLEKALALSKEGALLSASWGLPQILGSNYKMIGYATVEEMVIDFTDSEFRQLIGLVKFLESRKITKYLKDHNWNEVAKLYNGPQYQAHGYHLKLEKAYSKYKPLTRSGTRLIKVVKTF